MCAFLNKNYIEEAKICIESIRKNGLFTGPIYLFTDLDVDIENVVIIKATCETIPLSSSFRTRVFEYIKDYSVDDTFLYLDTDIVVLKPIPDLIVTDKIHVYGYPKRKQNESSFSGFLTRDKKFTSETAFSAGILLFKPSEKVKKVFDDTYNLYLSLLQKKRINSCWEQPALCFILIQENMHDISLNDYVYEQRTKSKVLDSHVFNHFCALRGPKRQLSMKKVLSAV